MDLDARDVERSVPHGDAAPRGLDVDVGRRERAVLDADAFARLDHGRALDPTRAVAAPKSDSRADTVHEDELGAEPGRLDGLQRHPGPGAKDGVRERHRRIRRGLEPRYGEAADVQLLDGRFARGDEDTYRWVGDEDVRGDETTARKHAGVAAALDPDVIEGQRPALRRDGVFAAFQLEVLERHAGAEHVETGTGEGDRRTASVDGEGQRPEQGVEDVSLRL